MAIKRITFSYPAQLFDSLAEEASSHKRERGAQQLLCTIQWAGNAHNVAISSVFTSYDAAGNIAFDCGVKILGAQAGLFRFRKGGEGEGYLISDK